MALTESSLMLTRDRARYRLRAEVGNRWLPGSRLPPVKQLAKMLGTGHTNMFWAVKQLADEGVLIARPRLGTFVHPDFRQHSKARVRTPKNATSPFQGKRIHLMYAPHDGFINPAVALLTRAMGDAGAQIISEHRKFDQVIESIESADAADALVLCNPSIDAMVVNPPAICLILSTSQSARLSGATGYDLVTVDSEQGGILAGRHLREVGAVRPCFVGRSGHQPRRYDILSQIRLEAFEKGFEKPIESPHCLYAPIYFAADGARACLEFLKLRPRPDAVFCASDDLAVGFAMQAIKENLTPGYDFQLMGFDGQLRGRHLSCGPLTTMDVPVCEMAEAGVELLRRRLADPDRAVQRIYMGCKLYCGHTTRMP